jgi:predicted DNA-binding antitoxin AbrB/MazE fold protein
MSLTIEAIYENGVLKPARPLPLKEHETVRITIEPQLSWAERTAGTLQWNGDFEDLRRIVEDDEFGIREARAETASDWVAETAGMIPWTGDHETLRRLAEDVEFDPQEPA